MQEVDLEILPFTKRWPYGDEKEYRAVYVNADVEMPAFPVPIALSAMKRITLSPLAGAGIGRTGQKDAEVNFGMQRIADLSVDTHRQQAMAEAYRACGAAADRAIKPEGPASAALPTLPSFGPVISSEDSRRCSVIPLAGRPLYLDRNSKRTVSSRPHF